MNNRDNRTIELLDECIRLIRRGGTDALADMVKRRPALRRLADTALRLNQVALRSVPLDAERIWQKISSTSGEKPSESRKQAGIFQIGSFKIAFSRPMLAIITIIVVIGMLNSTAVAAQNSIPGETLYPVKRTVEKIQLTLATNEVSKTEVQIKHAENRLKEAKAIVEQNAEPDSKTIETTIGELVDATAKVAKQSESNKDLLKKVVELTDKQEIVLTEIGEKVTGQAKQAVTDAKDAATITKSSAEKTLSDLEDTDPANNATTTPEQIPAKTNATSTPPLDKPRTQAPTSTTDTLEKLGEPATTTVEILPPMEYEESTTSAQSEQMQIVELK